MKYTLLELIVFAIASIATYYVWNYMAANYFHYKDIDFIQAAIVTALFRILTIKLN